VFAAFAGFSDIDTVNELGGMVEVVAVVIEVYVDVAVMVDMEVNAVEIVVGVKK
jgi:hypothetical protein